VYLGREFELLLGCLMIYVLHAMQFAFESEWLLVVGDIPTSIHVEVVFGLASSLCTECNTLIHSALAIVQVSFSSQIK
jgi:hypothetical protein